MSKGTSRLPGFYKMRMAERLRRLAEALELDDDDLEGLGQSGTLPLYNADAMIENAVGVLGLPVGLGLNFVVNGEEVLVPMAVEEPSVIAAASLAAKIARDGGGFQTDVDPAMMIEYGPFHNWKTKTHSSRFGRAKRGEDFLFYLRGNAGPVVPHNHHDGSGLVSLPDWFCRQGNARLAAIRAGFGGIGKKMGEDFGQRRFISQDPGQITGQ